MLLCNELCESNVPNAEAHVESCTGSPPVSLAMYQISSISDRSHPFLSTSSHADTHQPVLADVVHFPYYGAHKPSRCAAANISTDLGACICAAKPIALAPVPHQSIYIMLDRRLPAHARSRLHACIRWEGRHCYECRVATSWFHKKWLLARLPKGNKLPSEGTLVLQLMLIAADGALCLSNALPLVVTRSHAARADINQCTPDAFSDMTGSEWHQMAAWLHLLGHALAGHASEAISQRIRQIAQRNSWTGVVRELDRVAAHRGNPKAHSAPPKAALRIFNCYMRILVLLLLSALVHKSQIRFGFPKSTQNVLAYVAPLLCQLNQFFVAHAPEFEMRHRKTLYFIGITLCFVCYVPLSSLLSLSAKSVAKRRGWGDALILFGLSIVQQSTNWNDVRANVIFNAIITVNPFCLDSCDDACPAHP